MFNLEYMKNRNILFSLLVLVSLAIFPSVMSAAEPSGDFVWSCRPNARTGLYARSAISSTHALRVSMDGLYYFGDMEVEGFALGKPTYKNISAGASLSYIQSLGVVNMRYTVQGGFLQGDNEKASMATKPQKPRRFNSWFVRPSVGVEWYPVAGLGLYLYGGVGVAVSSVNTYFDVIYLGGDGINDRLGESFENEINILPMIPVELGYKFQLSKGHALDVHLGMSFGVVDGSKMTLDGWATPNGQDGTSATNKFTDGYAELGVAYSFSWTPKCKMCHSFSEL